MTTTIDLCAPVKRRKVNKAHTIKAWKKIKAKHKYIPVCKHPGKLEDLLTLPQYDLGQLVTLDDTIPIVTAPADDDGVTTVVTDDSPLAPMAWQEQVYVQTSEGGGQGGYGPIAPKAVPEPGAAGILAVSIIAAFFLARR